ncbi:hypothetical protein [Pseudidiomarina sp. YC-516-91]|uniref:hypothetical protein n=1 Tax=Pseudidiomarina salilacus TaxID=3384452 RepID=UPI003985640D
MDDKLSRLLQVTSSIYDLGEEQADDFSKLLDENAEGRKRLNQMLTSWSHWYSLTSAEFRIVSACVMGMGGILSESSKKGNRVDANLAFAEKIPDFELSLDDATASLGLGEDETQRLILQVFFANHYSQLALARRNRSLNVMLEQIRERVDDYIEIVFEAVCIDPSVVSNLEVANLIAQWTVANNRENLDKLAKAVAGKYPRGKRDESLDKHRLMTTALEEFTGSVTPETVDDMNQLLKLLHEGEDPIEAIKYHLRIRKKDTRRTRAHSSS